jgi:endonuclease/exonuclease/phosphatase family metal-dependent hydrolase
VKVCKSGAVDFVNDYFRKDNVVDLAGANMVSDHLPVFVRFGF